LIRLMADSGLRGEVRGPKEELIGFAGGATGA
jgi:hypothetical protein